MMAMESPLAFNERWHSTTFPALAGALISAAGAWQSKCLMSAI